MKRAIVFLFIGTACVSGGCRGATIGGLTANPQHEFSAKFNPVTRQLELDYFSNDGQELHIKNVKLVKGADGQGEFGAESIEVTDKSVENRVANVQQMMQDTQRFQMLFNTLDNAINRLTPGLNSAIGRAPPQPSPFAIVAKGVSEGLATKIGGQPAANGPDVGTALNAINARLDAIEQQAFAQRAAISTQPSK